VQAQPRRDSAWVLRSVAQRTLQSETALRTVVEHGRLTPFGCEFVAESFRELAVLKQAMVSFPPKAVKGAVQDCARHQARRGLGGTFLHNMGLEAQA